MENPASPLGTFAEPCVGTGEAPNLVLLEVFALLVPGGGDDLVDGDVVLAVQGAPHPRRLVLAPLEVRLLLVNPWSCFEM